jgi:hypothetical protein
MFETVRKNQKILQVILLILIVPSFVFLGVDSYTKSGDSKTDIAKVHQESITQVELENALKAQGQKLGITGQSLDNPNFKNAILGQLIQQKLLNFDLKSLNLQIPDETLAKEILKFPEVALLKKPDGSIDAEQYRQFLQNNGLTVAQFEKLKKYEMMGSDLQSALGGATGTISSDLVSQKLITSIATEREVQVIFFLADAYSKQLQLSEKDFTDYYQANPAQFQSTELVDVEYVVLSNTNKAGEDADFSKKADQFANLIYEQPDSLKPGADALGLKIQKMAGLTISGLSSLSKDHPLNNPKLLKAIFADESLKSNKNTEAIQINTGVLVAAHVVKHEPASTLPFEKVKSQITEIVKRQKSEELAVKDGQTQLEILSKNPAEKIPGKEFTKSFWVSRNKPLDLKGEPYEKVFGANENELPKVVATALPGSGYAIYRINRTRQDSQKDAKVAIEQFKQIAFLNYQNELDAYLENIRDRAGVKILRSIK